MAAALWQMNWKVLRRSLLVTDLDAVFSAACCSTATAHFAVEVSHEIISSDQDNVVRKYRWNSGQALLHDRLAAIVRDV